MSVTEVIPIKGLYSYRVSIHFFYGNRIAVIVSPGVEVTLPSLAVCCVRFPP